MFIDKKMLYVIMTIMIIWGLGNYINNPESLLSLLLTIPGLLLAITFHEFAHAFVADRLGDDTPRQQGRLTLNPLAHLDPIGSVLLLFAGFGWGKPVQVNPTNYDRRFSMDTADAIVSIAGPVMNFLLALILTMIYCAIQKFVPIQVISSQRIYYILLLMLNGAITINVGLGVFNLIPLPPLDGSKVIKPFLSVNIRNWFEGNENMFSLIFVALWIFRVFDFIIIPIISFLVEGFLNLGYLIFGI